MDVKKTRALLAASIAGLLATLGSTTVRAAEEPAAGGEKVACYGINKCKGTGDCGGKSSSCAGQNACSGQGFLKLDKETCLKIQGGRLTVEPEAS